MEYTTIRISRENYKLLEDILYENRLRGMDSALGHLIEENHTHQATIQELIICSQVAIAERDHALAILKMTIPELHQAMFQSKAGEN